MEFIWKWILTILTWPFIAGFLFLVVIDQKIKQWKRK